MPFPLLLSPKFTKRETYATRVGKMLIMGNVSLAAAGSAPQFCRSMSRALHGRGNVG
jgi:hypothetical protein